MQAENKYNTYQAEDFAQDTDFIRWVQVGDAADRKFWEFWLMAHPEKREEAQKAKAIIRLMKSKERELESKQIEAIWAQISDGMDEAPEYQLKPAFWQRKIWKFAAAAMLSIIIISFLLLRDTSEVVRAEFGQQMSYTLPDHSVVSLNAGSEIRFEEDEWQQERKLYLQGEAFFEVEKGSRFQVISTQGTVEVLGTSFNVYARDQKLEVACLTGKVRVSDAKGNEAAMLSPGQGVQIYQNQVSTLTINPEEAVDWKSGNFIYEDVSLQEVLQELERQYELKVVLQTDISDRKYSGQFSNQDLKSALQMICLPMELEYELDIAKQKVIIRQE
ncbi:FecR domain-containing protein [Porifericola rhodea]|uniref:FecR family protein n=1 Tax=Porifericola rhodea TaxID=930972 RepID=UPI0026651736|nr:FecR domain-containing protein [Porifericola rhodea]WKN33879.1 FecR domain-containing protein [Porifericola rhodea]